MCIRIKGQAYVAGFVLVSRAHITFTECFQFHFKTAACKISKLSGEMKNTKSVTA